MAEEAAQPRSNLLSSAGFSGSCRSRNRSTENLPAQVLMGKEEPTKTPWIFMPWRGKMSNEVLNRKSWESL